MNSKAISPMIATVLLIAFTVAVGGIISVWMQTFSSDISGTVGEETENQIYCSYAGISLSNVQYCNSHIYGRIENVKYKDLGSITLQVFYTNSTTHTIRLCNNGTSCASSQMSLAPGEIKSFNVSVDSGSYQTIRVYTNCSNVDDQVESSHVTLC